MKLVLLVGIGSFIGGIGRYLMQYTVQSRFLSSFPYGTLSVNILGCFIIGLVVGFSEKATLPSEWRIFLAVGICGGFTTFSSFSNETLGLLRNGQTVYALSYIASSIIIGVFVTYLGIIIAKLV